MTVSAGSIAQLYMNGVLAAETSLAIDSLPPADVFFIGKSLNDTDVGFNGSVNEFRIWGGILSQENVTQNYEDGPSKLFEFHTFSFHPEVLLFPQFDPSPFKKMMLITHA